MTEERPDPPGDVSCSILVRAEPAAVYDAFTTREGLDGWFTDGGEIDPRPGGRIVFRWRDWGPDLYTGEDIGEVLEAVRPSRFSFRWHPEGPGHSTTVAIDIASHPAGSVIRLRDRGFSDTPSGRRKLLECASGWGEALALWKFFVEHGLRY
jgi:uncharacterized protein YndB with AHSA1/START domain